MRRGLLAGLVVSAVLALGLLAAGCGGDGDEEAGPQTPSFELKIGNLVSFTGDLSPFGRPIDQSARIAARLANESAERVGLGASARIVASEDDQTDSTAAVEGATKLVQVDGVDVIMGALASANTIPVAESVTIPNAVVQISPASTSPAITDLDDDGFVWRTPPSDALQGRVLARAVADAFGSDATINVGTRNDAYGTALIGAFVSAWEAGGGTIGESVRWNPEAATFDSEAARLVSGNPDGWVVIDFPETWAKVGPALVRTGGWDPARTFTADGLRDTTLVKQVGRRATNGLRGSAPSSKGSPAGAAFDRVFRERAPAGVERQTFDAQAFDAVMLAFLAAVRGGTADPATISDNLQAVSGPPGQKVTFEQLDEALQALMEGEQIDYEGASGPIDFDSNGDPASAIYEVWRFEGGKIETIRSFPFAAEASD
jgi:ABC-type branched-subunit amino acid transport system substrate-binding protein